MLFRFNNRATKDKPVDERDRFMLAASRIPGKSLTQAELASKAGETKPEEPDRVRRSFTTESSRSPGSAPWLLGRPTHVTLDWQHPTTCLHMLQANQARIFTWDGRGKGMISARASFSGIC